MATTIDVTTENGTPYTWATANFDWNDAQADKSWENAANTIAAVNVGEPYAINDVMRPNINKRLLESIHVADTMKTSLQILRKDVLSIGETYWDNINFALKIAESFVVSELRKATITAIRKDQINFTEKVIKTDNKYFYEAFATQETALRSLNKIVSESFHLLETSNQAVTFLRTLAESLAVNEVLNKNVQYTREFAETIGVVQTYWDNIAFALRLMESIGISENEANTVEFHRTIAESFAVADVMNHTIARLVMILETLGISDFGDRTVDYKRTVLENIGTADLASQLVTFKRLFAELIKAQTLNAPAITSPTFTRASTAYKSDGSVVAAGEPRFEIGSKNLWYKSNVYVADTGNGIFTTDIAGSANYMITNHGTYTFSADITRYADDVVTWPRIGVKITYTDNTYTQATGFMSNIPADGVTRRLYATITTDKTKIIKSSVIWIFDYSSPTYRNIKAENIQLELGSVATAYEEYQQRLGVMVEEGTTNLFTSSEALFPHTEIYGGTITTKETVSVPEWNTTNATHFVFTPSSPTSTITYVQPAFSSQRVIGTTYTTSCYVKNNGNSPIKLRHPNESNPYTTIPAKSIGRYALSITATNTQWNKIAIAGTVAGELIDVVLYAPQAEQKTYATSFHPTTRAAESPTIPATALNASEGTIEFDVVPLAGRVQSGAIPYLLDTRGTSQTSLNNMFGIQVGQNQLILLYGTGTTYKQVSTSAFLETSIKKRCALRYVNTSISLWVDGQQRASGNDLSLILSDILTLGSTYQKDRQANALFSNLRISSIARSDEELAYTGPLEIDENTTYFATLTEDLDASVYESGEIVKDVEKPLAEAISASESNSKDFGIAKADSFAISDARTANTNKKILETLAFAETYWDNVNFALRILEAFAIQEGQHRNITHSAKETLGVGEFISKHDRKYAFENIVAQELNLKATTKKLSETLTTIDTATQIVDFLRTIAETLHVAEAPAQAVDFHRLFAEAAHMADSYKSVVTKLMAETLKVGRKQDTIANLVTNGDFSNGTTGWGTTTSATISTNNNVLNVVGTGNGAVPVAVKNTMAKRIGQKVYARMEAMVTNAACLTLKLQIGSDLVQEANPIANQWYALSKVSTQINDDIYLYVNPSHSYADASIALNKTMEVKNVVCIDLTAMFGAGNEPTLAECDVLFADFYRAEQAVEITQPHAETLHVAELPSKNLATLRKETLHIAETYWDNIAFIVRCLENIQVGEVIHNTNTFKRTWNESVALNENAARINEFNRLWQEAFGTTEGYANAVQFIRKTYETLLVNEVPKKNTAKDLQDAIAISDLAAKLVGKPLQAALRVTDKKAVNVAKLLHDTLHMVDFIDRNIAFVRKFFETFGTSDKIKQNVETLLRENFSMADKIRNTYQKAVSESFAIASDTFSRQVDFKLKIEEIISSIEGVAMEYGLEINEAINLLDDYITNVKAVLSNIAIREGEMTLADFQNAIATPPGYNTFRDFVVGDYEYQKALMRIVINAPATASQPAIKDVIPYVDIEDTDDRGEVTITQTTTATKVYFNKFYYNAPEVNVTLKGGSGVITPNIVSTTGLDEGGRYFEVELLNGSGNRVTGTFSWTSKGY